jgi:Mg/Co/Ni transporter MgtE
MEYSKEEALERQMLIDSITKNLSELDLKTKMELLTDWDDSKEEEIAAVDGYENWSDPNEWEEMT